MKKIITLMLLVALSSTAFAQSVSLSKNGLQALYNNLDTIRTEISKEIAYINSNCEIEEHALQIKPLMTATLEVVKSACNSLETDLEHYEEYVKSYVLCERVNEDISRASKMLPAKKMIREAVKDHHDKYHGGK